MFPSLFQVERANEQAGKRSSAPGVSNKREEVGVGGASKQGDGEIFLHLPHSSTLLLIFRTCLQIRSVCKFFFCKSLLRSLTVWMQTETTETSPRADLILIPIRDAGYS